MYPPTSICRVCLAVDVRFFTISGALQLIYEKITSIALHTDDGKPVVACYICYALLKKCHKLAQSCSNAENVLNAILHSGSMITVKSVSLFDRQANGLSESLSFSKAVCYDSQLPNPVEINTLADICDVKQEPSEEFDNPATCYTNVDMTEKEVVREGDPQTVNIMDIDNRKNTSNEKPSSPTHPCSIDVDKTAETGDIEAQNLEEDEEKSAEGSTTKRRQRESRRESRARTGEGPHQCNVCQRSFDSNKLMKIHIKTHTNEKPYSCKVCKRRFKRNDIMLRHYKTHNSEKPHECIICQRNFTRAEHLKRHLKSHRADKIYECHFCKKPIKGTEDIMKHVRSHAVNNYYECNVCQRRFNQKSNLIRHLKSHMDESHKCHVCQKWFKLTNSLARHLKTQHWRETASQN